MVLWPTPYGALTQLWAGTSPDALSANGKYIVPWARIGRMNPSLKDQKKIDELWDFLEGEVKPYL